MDLASQFAAIVFVFLLLGAALWALRRRGLAGWPAAQSGPGPARLEVLESRRLGPSHTIHLVRAGRRELVVAVHASGCTLLDAGPREETGRP